MGFPYFELLEQRLALSAGTYDFGQVGNYSVKAVVAGPGKAVSTFALTGGGSGHVAVSDSGLDVTLDNTTSATTLVISTKGGRTELHSISDAGSIGKISAPLVDVVGDVTIGGTISSLQLGNVFGGHVINIGSGSAGADVVLGTVSDTTINSATPFKTFSVVAWDDTDNVSDVITTPSIGSMKVKGDFDGTLHTSTIGAATVGGNWGGSTTITGDAGVLKMSHLRGDLTIDGKSSGISSKDYFFLGGAGGLGASPTGGVLHVAGTANVKSAKETFNAADATLYAASSAQVYSPQELLQYDSAGSVWNYNVTASVNGVSSSASTTDSVESAQGTIDNRVNWLTDSTDPANQTSTTTAFYRDATGTYETELDTMHTATGEYLNLDLGLLKVAPPMLGVGQSSTSSKRITGDLNLPASVTGAGFAIDMPVAGTASLSTKILGHESVSVPAATFLAVKMQITRTIDVSASARVGLFVFQRNIHITQTSTIYAAPGIGVVQDSTSTLTRTTTMGSANQSIASREDRVLLSEF